MHTLYIIPVFNSHTFLILHKDDQFHFYVIARSINISEMNLHKENNVLVKDQIRNIVNTKWNRSCLKFNNKYETLE